MTPFNWLIGGGEGCIEWCRVEVPDQVNENLAGWPQGFVLVAIEGKAWVAGAALCQRQGLEYSITQLPVDQVARQPGETEAAADEIGGGRQAADGPALLGAQPADITRLAASGVAYDYLQLIVQILEGQLALQLVQLMVGVGDRHELHFAEFMAQVADHGQAADGQVGGAFQQHFFYPRQHFLAQAHAATAALRDEGGQCPDQPCGRVGGVNHQAYLGFPALIHVVGQVFQLAGLLDQLPRTAQQHVAGLGEYGLASVDAQQRHVELFLHPRNGVAD